MSPPTPLGPSSAASPTTSGGAVRTATVGAAPAGPATASSGSFGPQTPGTSTAGLQEAANFLGAGGGGLLVVSPGSYVVRQTVTIPSKVEIRFANAEVVNASGKLAFCTAPNSSNISLSGNLTADGGNQPNRFFGAVSTAQFHLNLILTVRNMGIPFSFLFVKDSTGVVIEGALSSSDSAIIRMVDSSHVKVSGIRCVYTRDTGEVPVRLAGTRPMTDIEVFDVRLNGGGFRTGPLIDIAPDPGSPHATGISVHDIVVENPPNTTLFHDGIDIAQCDGVTVKNVSGAYVIVVLCLMSSRVTVSNVVGTHCRAQAVAAGDPTYMTEDISDISVDSCSATDCGSGYKGPASAGLAVLVTPGRSVTNVKFSRCRSTDSSGVQPHGFGVMAGAHSISAVDCQFKGTVAPVIVLATPSEVSLERCQLG